MSSSVVVDLLLAFAVASQVSCALGVLFMRNALDRLHFVGPATILGPLGIAAAAWVDRGLDPATVRALVVLVLLVGTGPILSYVMARVMVQRSER